MGIQGLLPLLKSIQKPTHLRNFAGQTLGVDAYGWLHRGTISCAIELAQQKPTRKHIDFALSRVRMLIHFGVKPFLVFDGDYLPSKAHTEKERAARRKESRRLGLELLNMGRTSQAYLELQKAIDVTPTMARELIEELKRLDVPYIVAPYEADSQLAYLEKQGIISGVLSEDSDLLVFGVKCLLTKLDQYGECVMVNRADFTACREISLVGWTDKEFRMMAILSGCDYLPGIDKMGLKTAYRLVRKHKNLERLVRSVQFDGKMKIPPGYLQAFDQAEKTFLYQRVFCPTADCLVHLNALPEQLESSSMPYIGPEVDAETAVAVAAGDLDPSTKQRIILSNASRNYPAGRTRVVQTPDEKQGKPISEFFKPKRTPLAELDPNSFAPSPSQQALLQNQRGASWSASQVPVTRPWTSSRATTSNVPSSAPKASNRSISDVSLDARRKSPKRQRLCSDSTPAASPNGEVSLPNTTSRFFSKPVEPSPSLRKPAAPSRRKDDFELWSDDSAAEAVAELMSKDEATAEPTLIQKDVATAVIESPAMRKSKKLKVCADLLEPSDMAPQLAPAAEEPSQRSVTTIATQHSLPQQDDDTPSTSFEAEECRTESNVFVRGVNADFTALKSKFTFQGNSPMKKAPQTSSMSFASQDFFHETQRKQLLGRLAKQTSSGTPPDFELDEEAEEVAIAVPASSPLVSAVRGTFGGVQDDDIPEDECLGTAHCVQGSEDCLIPQSPDSREDEEKTRPLMDLGRFMFAGNS